MNTQQNTEENHSLFDLLVLSLSNASLVNLGVLEDPDTRGSKIDLDGASHTIDILRMLREKTQGNLTSHEKELLEGMLNDLQMKYVELKQQRNG